jgi:eukaryotic-like serine/threonine-protein kinase
VLSRHLGSWGVVYVVRELDRENDARPETLIAKAMRPQFAADKDRMNRFELECNTWLSLGVYKHIARLYFADRLDGQVFAFGEYVREDGLPNTLRRWLDDNLIEAEFALRFGLHILWALDFARGRGLIAHLDLKPENVLITPDGVAKVTDWGLSRMVPAEVKAPPAAGASPYLYLGDAVSAAGGLGTRGYAAPEVTAPDYVPAPTADLFSFAVMLSEMLTGQRPPAGAGAAGVLPALSPLSAPHRDSLADLLGSCLSTRPQDRPQSTDDLIAALAAAFEDLVGVPAEPAPGPAFEAATDLGQRAYGLMMLGRTAEGLALNTELLRRVAPDDKKLDRPPVILMDYKERGWKPVIDEALLNEAESAALAEPADAEKLKTAIAYNILGNRLEHALELCDRLLAQTPDDPSALQQRADVLTDLGRTDEALGYLGRAIAIEPTSERWLDRAELLREQGDLEHALSSYESAVALDPKNAKALNGQGHLLARAGDHEHAVKAFRQATKADPELATAWYNLGTSLHALERRKQARKALLKAVEVDPELVQALNTLGVLARLDKDDQAALAFFRRATTVDPGYAKGWFNTGNVYHVAGQFDKAREAYERALSIDPGYALAKAGLDQLAEMGW